jgi:archaellum component FlaC
MIPEPFISTSSEPKSNLEELIIQLSQDMKEVKDKLDKYDGRFDEMNNRLRVMNSRIGDLENNIRDISSIQGAVRRIMGVGFQEIPYEMNGRAAVEEIKDYY